MGQAAVPQTTEPLNPQLSTTASMKVEETTEPMRTAAEFTEPMNFRVSKCEPTIIDPGSASPDSEMPQQGELKLEDVLASLMEAKPPEEPYLDHPLFDNQPIEPIHPVPTFNTAFENPPFFSRIPPRWKATQSYGPDYDHENADPFEVPSPGLLITKGFVHNKIARILFDTGCVGNILSKDFCDKHQIPYVKREDTVTTLANGEQQDCGVTVNPVTISLGPYTEKFKFIVTTIQMDVILGKSWKDKHQAKIDCSSNTIEFMHKKDTYWVRANEYFQQTSLNSIVRDFNMGCPMFSVLLRSSTSEPEVKNHGEISKILSEYTDVFPDELPKGLPPQRIQGDFRIELKEDAKPVKKGLYRMSHTEIEETKRQVEHLLDMGFIRPSKSPWASPVLFASKKDGGLRFCVDYRALNRFTVKNSYPLPRIDNIMDQVGSAKYFSTIDLRSGYHQMRVAPEDIPKTAFNTRYGHYEYTVVPFGLTNAPAAFMNIMNDVFSDFVDKFVMVYLDDILIFSDSWEEHVKHIRLVLERLRKHKLYAKISKCKFGVQEADYLGFVLRAGKLAMNPNKTRAIEAWETPKTKKELQSFLGLVNYYRRFIRNCSKIAKPLTELTKNVPFNWNKSANDAFKELKRSIITAPVLAQFNPKKEIYVTTDASKYAIGAVMEQDYDDGRHPVAFISRTLNPHEQNYAAHDLELLGIVDTLRTWRCYLHGRKFVIHTDHHPLKYLSTQEFLSPRQVRWLERIASFDFNIVPIKGKSNQVADGLSRQTSNSTGSSEYSQNLLKKVLSKTTFIAAVSTLTPGSELTKKLVSEYKTDPSFKKILRQPTEPFEIRKGLLFRGSRLCIPKGEIRNQLLHDYHSTPGTGHLGESKTLNRLTPKYYWKGMRNTVKEFVKSCRTCQQIKSRNHKPFGLLQPIEPPETKWDVITMDFITPLPETKNGNSGILNVVCKLSKMIRIIPIKSNITAPETAMKFKEHVYRSHGFPSKIISDRDSLFMSKFWKSLFSSLGTKIAPSTAYHPQTDGQSEIANRKVEEMIRAFANYRKDNWDDHLVDFEVAYNSAVHNTTLCSPFYLNYGIHPKTIPIDGITAYNPTAQSFLETMKDTTDFAYKRIIRQNARMAEYANKSRIPHEFSVDDQVWLSTKNLSIEDGSGMRKLHPKFCGPFKIVEKINDVTFRLELPYPMKAKGIHDSFHCSLLKPFVPDTFGRYDEPLPPVQIQDGSVEYEVEAILDSKVIRGKKHFLVKWKGYGDHENTWQTAEDLQNAKQALKAFRTSRRRST